MENPSISEANKVVRVLTGKPLKYTVRVHLPESILEYQSDKLPKVKFNEEDRSLWLVSGEYETTPIMRWPDGAIMLTEENPKP